MTSLTAHLLTEARAPESGLLDARRTASTLGLSLKELAQGLHRDASGLGKHPTSSSLQPALQEYEALGLQLRDVFGDLGTARMWLRAPNPVIGGQAPVEFLLSGQPVGVRRLLTLAETGTPT